MKNIYLLILTVIVLLSCKTINDTKNNQIKVNNIEAENYYNLSEELNKSKDYKGAYETITKAINIDKNVKYLIRRAIISLFLKDEKNFFSDLNECELLEPQNYYIYSNWATIYKDVLYDQYNYYTNSYTASTIKYLEDKNIKITNDFFGSSYLNYKKTEGKELIIMCYFDKYFKPLIPVPKIGDIIKFGANELNFINGSFIFKGTNYTKEQFIIKDYRLVTFFFDSSQEFYQIYYKVKY